MDWNPISSSRVRKTKEESPTRDSLMFYVLRLPWTVASHLSFSMAQNSWEGGSSAAADAESQAANPRGSCVVVAPSAQSASTRAGPHQFVHVGNLLLTLSLALLHTNTCVRLCHSILFVVKQKLAAHFLGHVFSCIASADMRLPCCSLLFIELCCFGSTYLPSVALLVTLKQEFFSWDPKKGRSRLSLLI